MKKNGVTLVELVITMVIVGIAGLAITVYFVSEYRFRQAAEERIVFAREARAAMDHIARVLKFAVTDPVITENPPIIDIDANIEGGHLSFINGTRPVWYHYEPSTIEFGLENPAEGPFTIANHITGFQVIPNPPELVIMITAGTNDGRISIPLRTTIRLLPE